MLHKKSMRDTACDLMAKKKKPITFEKLWNEVSELLGLTLEEKNEKISEFYTQITLDGRFIFLEENTWDLKSRHTFDKISIDMNDIYTESDEDDLIAVEEDDYVIDDIDRLVSEEEKDDDDEDEENEESVVISNDDEDDF